MQFSSIFHHLLFHNITVRLFSTFDRRYSTITGVCLPLHMVQNNWNHRGKYSLIIFYVSFTQRLLAASIALPVHSNGYGKGSDVCVSRLDVR